MVPSLREIARNAIESGFPANIYSGFAPYQSVLPHNVIMFNNQTKPGHRDSIHHRYVLITNLETTGSVVLDGNFFPLSPGKALLIFPHQFHHYADFVKDSIFWLFITFEMTSEEPLASLRNRTAEVSLRAWDYLKVFTREYLRAQSGRAPAEERLPLHLGLYLSELREAERYAQPESRLKFTPDQERIRQVCKFIYQRLDKPLHLEDLAEQAHLSASHLRALFRQAFGISLGKYVARTRINQASRLLASSKMNVSEIALACGFDSLYSFSRAFKRETGRSPKLYREYLAGLKNKRKPD
jgi:AraC-like DNA-binding protein